MKTLLSLFQRILPLVVFVVLFHGSVASAQCSGGAPGLEFPCTDFGTAEAQQALSLLRGGMDVNSVAAELDRTRPAEYASVEGDIACVGYPSGPYVGCREFYMAQPDDGRPTDNSTWIIVMRCSRMCQCEAGCLAGQSGCASQSTTGGAPTTTR